MAGVQALGQQQPCSQGAGAVTGGCLHRVVSQHLKGVGCTQGVNAPKGPVETQIIHPMEYQREMWMLGLMEV